MSPATITKLVPRRKPAAEHRAHDKTMKLNYHTPSGLYVIAYYDPKRPWVRRSKSTGCQKLKAVGHRAAGACPPGTCALCFLDRYRDEIGSARRGHETIATGAQAAMTVADVLPCIVADYRQKKRRAVNCIVARTKAVAKRLGGQRIETLSTQHVLDARDDWDADGYSENTINHWVSTLRRSIRLAFRHGQLATLPDLEWPKYDDDAHVREGWITDAEITAVNAAEPLDAWRDFNRWAFLTGMRRNEIVSLTWTGYDPATYTVRLHGRKTKGGKGRALPCVAHPEMREILDRRLAAREPGCALIFHVAGRPLIDDERWAATWIRAALPTRTTKKGNLAPEKLFHDLRRTAVRNLILAGVDEKRVMLISGHRTRAIFDRYNITEEKEIGDALGRLVPAAPAVVAPHVCACAHVAPALRPRSAPIPRPRPAAAHRHAADTRRSPAGRIGRRGRVASA